MPANANVHIDTFLTGVAGAYSNSDFIADQILPIVPSAKESGKVAQYGTEHYRLDFNARAMGADTPRGDWQATTPVSFQAQDWEFEIPVDDRQIPYYDDPFDANIDATNNVMAKIMLKREDIVATLLGTSGNFGGTTAAGTVWATSATATPVTNVRAAMEAIRARTGVGYGSMVGFCSSAIWNKMIQTSELKGLFLSTLPGAAAPNVLNPQIVANAIGLKAIYVGSAVKLTSKEGDADVFADVWTSTVFGVAAVSPRPSFMAPGFGVLISPTVQGFKGAYVAVDRYREEKKRSTIVRAAALFDCIAVTKALGQLVTGC